MSKLRGIFESLALIHGSSIVQSFAIDHENKRVGIIMRTITNDFKSYFYDAEGKIIVCG